MPTTGMSCDASWRMRNVCAAGLGFGIADRERRDLTGRAQVLLDVHGRRAERVGDVVEAVGGVVGAATAPSHRPPRASKSRTALSYSARLNRRTSDRSGLRVPRRRRGPVGARGKATAIAALFERLGCSASAGGIMATRSLRTTLLPRSYRDCRPACARCTCSSDRLPEPARLSLWQSRQ